MLGCSPSHLQNKFVMMLVVTKNWERGHKPKHILSIHYIYIHYYSYPPSPAFSAVCLFACWLLAQADILLNLLGYCKVSWLCAAKRKVPRGSVDQAPPMNRRTLRIFLIIFGQRWYDFPNHPCLGGKILPCKL